VAFSLRAAAAAGAPNFRSKLQPQWLRCSSRGAWGRIAAGHAAQHAIGIITQPLPWPEISIITQPLPWPELRDKCIQLFASY
jgi:hypothetical protein